VTSFDPEEVDIELDTAVIAPSKTLIPLLLELFGEIDVSEAFDTGTALISLVVTVDEVVGRVEVLRVLVFFELNLTFFCALEV
jgi:hypothetical protein